MEGTRREMDEYHERTLCRPKSDAWFSGGSQQSSARGASSRPSTAGSVSRPSTAGSVSRPEFVVKRPRSSATAESSKLQRPSTAGSVSRPAVVVRSRPVTSSYQRLVDERRNRETSNEPMEFRPSHTRPSSASTITRRRPQESAPLIVKQAPSPDTLVMELGL